MNASDSFLRLLLAVALGATVPAVGRAQQPAPAPAAPTPAPPAAAPAAVPGGPISPNARRTVEIRAQAPAPEVITVRPREVPQYTRRLIAPALLTPADTTGASRAGVVVPAPASAEARAAAASDRRTRTP
jgi:hypothetical protein